MTVGVLSMEQRDASEEQSGSERLTVRHSPLPIALAYRSNDTLSWRGMRKRMDET